MKSKFLALAIATAALNVFAPAVGHAQNYIVNGHKRFEGRGAVAGLLQRSGRAVAVRRIWHLASCRCSADR